MPGVFQGVGGVEGGGDGSGGGGGSERFRRETVFFSLLPDVFFLPDARCRKQYPAMFRFS